jgi:hypothetical protein
MLSQLRRYKAANRKIILKDELARMWKKANVTYFDVRSQHFLGITLKTAKSLSEGSQPSGLESNSYLKVMKH